MSSSKARCFRQFRSAMRRFLRPMVDNLEFRTLLSTTPFEVHPLFELGPLVAYTNPPSSAKTPTQILTGYGFNSITFNGLPANGSGETIAIVDAFDDPGFINSTNPGFSSSDLAQFDSTFHIPDPPSFTKVDEFGGTNYPSSDPS